MTESQPESSPLTYLLDTQRALLDALTQLRKEQRDLRRVISEIRERLVLLNAGIDELP